MPEYKVGINATTNSVADTEDAFIELLSANPSVIRVKRIRIACQTASQDGRIQWRLLRTTTAGATGAAGTAVKKKPGTRATGATVNVKNAAVAFTVGTVGDIFDQGSLNTRAVYEWVPRGDEEVVEMTGDAVNRLVLGIKSSIVSLVLDIYLEYED
jgi:hypothetical protein